MKTQLNKLIRYTYGIVDLTDTIYNNTGNLLFVFCLTNVMMFSLESTLLISSVASTFMAISTFFTGPIISGVPAMKWGRHRGWLVIMAPIAAIGFVFKFTRVGGSETFAAWIVILAYIIGGIANGFCYNANGSLLNVISSNEKERALLARNRGFATALAGVVYSYTSSPLAMAFAAVVGLATGYTLMAVTVAVINMLAMYYTVYITKGYETDKEGEETNDINTRVPVKVMLKCLIQNRSLIGLFLADITRFASNMTLMGTVAYYFTYVVQNTTAMAQYILWGGILQTVGAFVSGKLSSKFSARRMILLAELAVCVSVMSIRLVGYNLVFAFIVLMIYRFSHGFSYSMFFNCYADCVVYGEWKTKMLVPGFTFGLSSIAAQLGTMIKSWLLPIILIMISFDASVAVADTPISVRNGLLSTISLVPAGIRLIGVIMLFVLYNLSADMVRKCQEEIKARKMAAQS